MEGTPRIPVFSQNERRRRESRAWAASLRQVGHGPPGTAQRQEPLRQTPELGIRAGRPRSSGGADFSRGSLAEWMAQKKKRPHLNLATKTDFPKSLKFMNSGSEGKNMAPGSFFVLRGLPNVKKKPPRNKRKHKGPWLVAWV